VALHRGEQTLAVGFGDGHIELRDLSNITAVLRTLQGHKHPVQSLAFAPDGSTLLSGAGSPANPDTPGEVKLWDPVKGQASRSFPWPAGPVHAVAFAPDGKRVAAGGAEGVKVWDLAAGKDCPVPAGLSRVLCLAFAPDGRTVAAAGADGAVTLWDPATGKVKGTLRGHTGEIGALCFPPDGRTLVTGSRDRTLRLWDLGSREARAVSPAPQGSWVRSLACSRDGSVLALGLNHHQTLLKSNGPDWHEEPVPLITERDVGGQVAFAEDGNLLVTAHRNGTLGVWRYAPAKSADFRR
jgi:WD40 repeat protein